MSESVYQNLVRPDGFRVLILEPGLASDPIICRLAPSNLSRQSPLQRLKRMSISSILDPSHLPFEAISYAWGNPLPSTAISVNGVQFGIGENLFQALCHLRLPTQTRNLWADAICINQEDILERNQQVSIMRQIYQTSKHTHVWLRESIESDKPILDMFRHCDSLLRKPWLSTRSRMEAIVRRFFDSKRHPEMIASTRALLSTSWFTRVWVLQEFAVSPRLSLTCGEHQISFKAFQALVTALRNSAEILTSDLVLENSLNRIRQMVRLRKYYITNSSLKLFDLISVLDGKHTATDPRDMIFALIGLMNYSSRQIELVANYNLDLARVFTMAVKQCNSQGNLFEALSCIECHPTGQFRPSLPSWVPDFHSAYDFRRRLSVKRIYSAGGEYTPISSFESDDSILVASGKLVDTVDKYLQYPYQNNLSRRRWYRQCKSLIDEVAKGENYPTGETLQACWWRILVHDAYCTRSGGWKRAIEEYGAFYLDEEVARPTHVVGYQFSESEEMSKLQNEYFNTSSRSAAGMSFCTTSKTYSGWTPRQAQAGDRLCIFRGAAAPFLIRDKPDGTYQLIGEAYIHGIMDGEAVDWEGYEWEDIRLS